MKMEICEYDFFISLISFYKSPFMWQNVGFWWRYFSEPNRESACSHCVYIAVSSKIKMNFRSVF